MKNDARETTPGNDSPEREKVRRPYAAPRIEKRQPVARVTLLSGMGAMSVGVISVMN
jgi:hypothetical protein